MGKDDQQPEVYRLAVDIGGTFTDAVLINETTGQLFIDKVLSTPADPTEGFLNTIGRLTRKHKIDSNAIRYIIHGTTVATNALLERQGAKAALLVTKGFRDVLEIGRQIRHELYNLQIDKPQPLIPRELCIEIPERIDFRGCILNDLNEDFVALAVNELKARGVDSIAICFLHSYVNGDHETRAADIIRSQLPGASISISSDIAPEIREYWRASTTVINAYVAPKVQRYLRHLAHRLEKSGVSAEIHVMQSSGGLMTLDRAGRHPFQLLESGPSAGVQAAAYFARIANISDAIAFDMGGTTAKMGVIQNGQPRVVPEFEAGGVAGTGVGIAPGSGYPVLASVTDLVEVGAGGGSIAWVDDGGLLRVGPRSAGSDPGPACYGRGGVHPTVTDANLVLGRLNPEYFLGGEIILDLDASTRAIETHCAKPLGYSLIEAAKGIVAIANAMMSEAMRLVSVQRGIDPRGLGLVVSGGAAPAHAVGLAKDLGIPSVLVPSSPGTASALGMLVSDLRHEFRTTRHELLSAKAIASIQETISCFEGQAETALAREGISAPAIEIQRYVEMRYLGQSWSLQVPLDRTANDISIQQLLSAFHNEHQLQYGYAVQEEPVELVNIGLRAIGRIPPLRLRDVQTGEHSCAAAVKTHRSVYFSETNSYTSCPIIDRYSLRKNNRVTGPAIIEEADSTTVIPPGFIAHVIEFGMLLIRQTDTGFEVAPAKATSEACT